MSFYVELMCDEHKQWPNLPEYEGRVENRCHSDNGDNPQGSSIATAKNAGKRAGWIINRGGYCCCPGCMPLPGEGIKLPASEAEMLAARSPAGGWTKKQLAMWGVPWPPPRGWKKRLLKLSSKTNL